MRRVLILIVVVLAAGAGLWGYFHATSPSSVSNSQQTQESAATSSAPYVAPALTQSYTNSNFGFSLMMPADFSASESQDPSSGADVIVLQNASGDGIQISVTPFSEDTGSGYMLTEERIQQDQPNLEVDNPQPVNVGPNYTGLAFISDNPAWGGDSREVWFVFKGNLYQISTYARLDPLMQAIFKTWRFN